MPKIHMSIEFDSLDEVRECFLWGAQPSEREEPKGHGPAPTMSAEAPKEHSPAFFTSNAGYTSASPHVIQGSTRTPAPAPVTVGDGSAAIMMPVNPTSAPTANGADDLLKQTRAAMMKFIGRFPDGAEKAKAILTAHGVATGLRLASPEAMPALIRAFETGV